MRRYLALFGAASIRCLIADRKFIGVEWMDFLNQNNIPFAIRVRVDMTVTLQDGRTWSLATLLRRRHARHGKLICQGRINRTAGATHQPVHLAAKRLRNDEWLIVAANRPIQTRRSAIIASAGASSACSATPRPAASISRTPTSPIPKSWMSHRHARHHLGLPMRHKDHGHEGHTAQKPRMAREVMVPHRPRRPQGLDRQSTR